VTSVTDMTGMFDGAYAFDQDIDSWENWIGKDWSNESEDIFFC
jgi:hypothetical protein